MEVQHLELLERGCRPARARSPSAGRSSPTSRAPTAGGRTAAARTRAAPSPWSSSQLPSRPRYGSTNTCSGRSSPAELVDCGAAVEVLPAVAVPVDGEQHLRLDLREAVDDAADAELGRRRRPDRAERGAGEERRDRLGDVRQVRGDAVAAADAVCVQPARIAAVAARSSPHVNSACVAQLGGVHDRDRLVVVAAEDMLGVGELGAREPPCAGHRRGSSRTRSYGRDARTSKNSQIDAQNASTSLTDHRHSSS